MMTNPKMWIASVFRSKIYDGFGQDDLGIWCAPGGTSKVAWFNNPDGNVLSLAELQ